MTFVGTRRQAAEVGSPRERPLEPARLGDHIDRLFRAAWALSGSREDAEDLVQETYARVLARPRLLRNEDDLGYLLRALRNTFLNQKRSEGRRLRPGPLPDEPEDQKGKTRGMIVILHAPRPIRAPIEVKATQVAQAKAP